MNINILQKEIENEPDKNPIKNKLMCIMSECEALTTNERYTNENVIWGRPKGLIYGNLVGAGVEQKANLYPDKSATYFVANVCLPKNSHLKIEGQYPHARYLSFTVSNQLGSGQIGNGDFLRGDQIIPNPDSSNPFLASCGRNVKKRNFTIFLVQGNPPINPVPVNNTLYSGTYSEKDRIHLSIRTYLVDRGYDGTGNILLNDEKRDNSGLPEVSLVFEGGESVTGPKLVKILRALKQGDPNGYELNQWLMNVRGSKNVINAPCFPVLAAQVFWNTDYSVTGAFEASHPEERVVNYPPNNDGGFANNPDTRYMAMPYSFGFGEVVVVQGKMPTHPKTLNGDVDLPEDPQVQYFSISTAAAPNCGEGWDTVCDEQIPLNEKGEYTVIVSWPWNRPANATLKNGICWLDPKAGEGHFIGARNWIGIIFIRYQNSSSKWKNSPLNIPMPSIHNPIPEDPIVMGPYYPFGNYMSKADFEKLF